MFREASYVPEFFFPLYRYLHLYDILFVNIYIIDHVKF